MTYIDLTLVSGSRPELLEQTLASFRLNVFNQIRVRKVFVNIDLHGGLEKDRQKCVQQVLAYFPKAVITTPAVNSFGAAVKYLWGQPETDYFLHLEDDWVAVRKLPIARIKFKPNSKIRQLFLVKPRIDQSLLTSFRYRPVSGLPFFLPNIHRPAFTTSPSVINSQFARDISELMIRELNPEKQMFNGLNLPLERFLLHYRSRALVNWWEKPLINDIGRAWQNSQGIRVEIENGIHKYKRINLD